MENFITISLSRLHKVVDRIKARIQVVHDELQVAARAEYVSATTTVTAERIARLQKLAAPFDLQLAELSLLHAEHARMRGLVGQYNEEYGVGPLLAKQDALSREKAKLSELVTTNCVALNSIVVGSVLEACQLSPLTEEQTGKLQQRIDSLTREGYAISDKIAEANARTVTFAMSPELNKLVFG